MSLADSSLRRVGSVTISDDIRMVEMADDTPSTVADAEDDLFPVQYESLGDDYPLTEDMKTIDIHTSRLKGISNLDQCPNLEKIVIVASLIERISGLEAVPKLTHLELYQAKLRRMENVAHLHDLKTLDLSFNGIRELCNITELTELENLYLPSNKIQEVNETEVCTLTKLKLLELGANRIRTVTGLNCLISLEQLWLGKNKIDTMKMPILANLRILDLRSNRLTTWDSSILELPALQELYLSHNNLTDVPDDDFFKEKLTTLTILDVSANALTTIKPLLHLTNLKEIYLHECKLKDEKEIKQLSKFHQLDTLYMATNPFGKMLGPMYRERIIESCSTSLLELDGNDIVRFHET